MGFLTRALGLDLTAAAIEPSRSVMAAQFAQVGGVDIDPAVFGLAAYTSPVAPAPRVDRRTAIQCAAVKRSRDLIAGTLGGLPFRLMDAALYAVPSPLLEQPERNVAPSITMARLFEDLLFEGIAWWLIDELSWDGWPRWVTRLDPSRVRVDERQHIVYVDGKETPSSELIRFDSPSDPLLIAGARAIRTCLALDAYAANAANGVPPVDYFTPSDGDVDGILAEDDETQEEAVTRVLNGWAAARQSRSTAYVPAHLKYNIGGFDPKTLQMAEQRDHAVKEIARHAGIDADELAVAVTSRTYSNQFDRRKAFVDFTLGQYYRAVEGRLSMADVTPRGYTVRIDLDEFMRSDPASRFAAYRAGIDVGAIDPSEVRPAERKPTLTSTTPVVDPETSTPPLRLIAPEEASS